MKVKYSPDAREKLHEIKKSKGKNWAGIVIWTIPAFLFGLVKIKYI